MRSQPPTNGTSLHAATTMQDTKLVPRTPRHRICEGILAVERGEHGSQNC